MTQAYLYQLQRASDHELKARKLHALSLRYSVTGDASEAAKLRERATMHSQRASHLRQSAARLAR